MGVGQKVQGSDEEGAVSRRQCTSSWMLLPFPRYKVGRRAEAGSEECHWCLGEHEGRSTHEVPDVVWARIVIHGIEEHPF